MKNAGKDFFAQFDTEAEKAAEAFCSLCKVAARLRAPGGCPWDREQTPLTIRGNMIEEAYEAAEAIAEGSHEHIKEELGDLMLNALMAALMYQEEGAFTIEETLSALSEKLIRRHPHVFAKDEGAAANAAQPDGQPAAPPPTSGEVLRQWERIKRDVEGKSPKSILGGVSASLPAVLRAEKLQKKAARAGFDFPRIEDAWQKVKEEAGELRAESSAQSPLQDRMEEEAGDFLFAAINLLRSLNVDSEIALMRANKKFERRFAYVEKALAQRGSSPEAATLEEMDALWNEAKGGEST